MASQHASLELPYLTILFLQYVELIKGHLDKAVAEAKAAGREGINTDTKALAVRIDDTMHKHFGGLS